MDGLCLHESKVERIIGGRRLSISTGLVAKQAAGAVMVQYGDTIVLTAVTCASPRSPDQDFFPLSVDYREKTYAAGKFPGGFFKREKAPAVKEIVTMRLADRPIRPLFPDGYRQEVLVQSIVLSADMENDPDILSVIGASAALHLSHLPFLGPVGAVRIGRKDGAFILNPTIAQTDNGDLNLVLAGTKQSVTMVEASARELREEEMIAAIAFGHETIKTVVEMQEELRAKISAPAKEAFIPPPPPACLPEVAKAAGQRLTEALLVPGKCGRREAVRALRDEIVATLAKAAPETPTAEEVKAAFSLLQAQTIRDMVKKGCRVDRRDLRMVRPIDCRVGILPRVHGSALFTRGETQALVAITLGAPSDAQKVDGLREAYDETWFIHYNAPGFSVGEAKPPRAPGRREIGHGVLAQRALQAVMPSQEEFPYTVRAVSEILEMNGSSSMATVCGATLALMDAGVPIRKPVAGIAMGLIEEEGEPPVVISDILGDEDHCGDMDFKVCGTADGITALQMDIKVTSVSIETMGRALTQAREGRLHILERMRACISAPRPVLSSYAPRLHAMQVATDLLGKIIGPGGKTVRNIQDQTGVKIDIEDSGRVSICAPDGDSLQKAVAMIEALVIQPEIGAVYQGKVTGVREFGCFVEILPSVEGMCHVSELAHGYVKRVEDVCKVGDVIEVKVLAIDEDSGKIRLSRKALLPPPPSQQAEQEGERRQGHERSRGRTSEREEGRRRGSGSGR